MTLGFVGDEQVVVHRLIDALGGQFARGCVPACQPLDRVGQGIGDDVVFDRPEQHRSDGDDKCHENKDQQRRNQQQCAAFLAAQSAREAAFQRCAVSGHDRSVFGILI
nr:hypothetical protein [Pseudosulfitobacter pseudonitzschiae]